MEQMKVYVPTFWGMWLLFWVAYTVLVYLFD